MKWNFKYLYILALAISFLSLFTTDLLGQSSKELDKKKQENIEKLRYSRNLLEKTSVSKTTTLNKLSLIQENISLGSEIISNITEELNFLKSDINQNNNEIIRIETIVGNIKEEYAQLIISTSRNLDNDFALMYIYSSGDFNQAYQRIRYLKFLARYREELAKKLYMEEMNLKNKNQELLLNKNKNEKLLLDRKRELRSLDKDKLESQSYIRSLQTKETELRKEIQTRERIQSEIENEIRRLIEEEVKKARESKKSNILTAEENIISGDFAKNKGKLPWPSESGLLTSKYGEQNHPVLKGIKIRSNGIDINTVESAQIRSIFDGEVTKVVAILGANYTVIIKHGVFRSVYQNLVNVKVKAGDKVKTKEAIGTVFTDKENVSKYHFEIWMDKETQNPEFWLAK